MKTMRMIYLVQYFPPEKASGLQLVEDLLEGFADYGWKIDVFTPTPTRGVTKEQRRKYSQNRIEKRYDGKLTIHRMHLYQEGNRIPARIFRYFIFSAECLWKCLTVPADFIFTGSGPPTQGVVAGLAKIFSHKKIIYNLQDIFPDSMINAGICSEDSFMAKLGRKMEKFIYHNVDHVITISEDMKLNVIRKGMNPQKVTVVRNWIDVDTITPIPRDKNKLFHELGLSCDKFYVLYAGNLGKVQGIDVIINSAEASAVNSNIHFIIFGNGSEEENIRRLIKEKNLKNISLYPLQPAERVSEVYSLGDVSLIPCRPGTGRSGMPSKTWTIMAAGTAIIGSFDVNSELDRTLRKAECGYCIEPGNSKLLAKEILDLYENPSKLRKMGISARKYAEKYVSREQAVKRYISVIDSLSNAKRKE